MPRRLLACVLGALLAATACSSDGVSTSERLEPSVPTASAVPAPTSEPTATPQPTATVEPTPTRNRGVDEANQLLAFAELRWRESGITDYTYVLQRSCECPEDVSAPRYIFVRDGEVVAAETDGNVESPHGGYTAEDLFALVRAALIDGKQVDVTYDGNGFPSTGVIDVEAVAVDGGFVYETFSFRELPGLPTPPAGTSELEIRPIPATLVPACDAVARIEQLDDPTDDPEVLRETVLEMRRLAEVIQGSVPPELADGAAGLVSYFDAIIEAAEAAEWSPEFIDTVESGGPEALGIDIGPVAEFADELSSRCDP